MSDNERTRLLVTGASGQLGRALSVLQWKGVEIIGLSRSECDITNRAQVDDAFDKHRPTAVINAAAYTAVDQAESDSEAVYRTNVKGVENLVVAAKRARARVVHVSTDYVFNGASTNPYGPDSRPDPLGVYGESKLEGEQVFSNSGVGGVIVRTAWLYSATGKNFLNTILRLIRSGTDLRVVSDQLGTPTAAPDLAHVLLRCALDPELHGVAHWTNSGMASWYDFAVAIQDRAAARGLIQNKVPITPITTEEYPTPARRPAFSLLDCSLLWSRYGRARDWRDALDVVLDSARPSRNRAISS